MGSCIKLSEGAALGMHACLLLARHPQEFLTVAGMAERLQGSGAHLSKVMQRLAKSGLVKGARGPQGGFRLAKTPAEISLLHIFIAIEGDQTPARCVFEHPICDWEHCLFDGLIQSIDGKFLEYLKNTNLAAVGAVTQGSTAGRRRTPQRLSLEKKQL